MYCTEMERDGLNDEQWRSAGQWERWRVCCLCSDAPQRACRQEAAGPAGVLQWGAEKCCCTIKLEDVRHCWVKAPYCVFLALG